MDKFKLVSKYKPTGDQPQAIDALVKGVLNGDKEQTLMGVTGSGKTYTAALVAVGLHKRIGSKKPIIIFGLIRKKTNLKLLSHKQFHQEITLALLQIKPCVDLERAPERNIKRPHQSSLS